jgi:hypothetical protein
VSECVGSRDRLVAVLTFFTKPNMKNSPLVQKMFWGRSSEEEEEEEEEEDAGKK